MRMTGPKTRGQVDQQLIQTDVSAPQGVPQGPKSPKGWEARQAAREASAANAAALLAQMTTHLGGILTAVKAPPTNDVLVAGTVKLNAAGIWTHNWPSAFAAVTLANTSGSTVTAHSSPPTNQAPTLGTGVVIVPSGIERTFAMRGT
ncbi:MAG TPA: hypothetical protein VHW47_07870, partial [Acidimicrobiales bacterium]|nr:hypothetical protein [Acidimicrobiales bacterium]